jgi:hypothetical protein
MKRGIIIYLAMLVLLCFGIGARADNVITLSSVEGAPGEEVTVSIGLQNTDVISSLQVSIPLDENLSLVDDSGLLGSRCGSHSLVLGVKDGVLNVFIYSLSMTDFTGNSGEVASFKLKLGNQPKTVTLTSSKTVLTNSSGTSVSSSSGNGTITTRCAKAQYGMMTVDFGEVPILDTYTKSVTVTNVGNADLTITALTFSDVNVFSSTTALPLTVAAGASKSLNITYAPVERGSVNRTLKVECNSVSKLNTIALKAKPFAVNELHIQPASGISDEEVTISMTMNNMDDISGFQIEFILPEQLEYVNNSFALSNRKQDHTVVTSLTGNVLRIITYSGNDLPFTGNDGEIGSFKVKLVGRNGTTLTPTKTVLSATINNHVDNVVSAVYGGSISISSPQINCSNSVDFGAVSVTEACEKAYTIRNNGSAPLTISRIVFDNEALSIKEALPIVIPASGNATITVAYSSIEQAAFTATMQIYSNDPDQRMKNVTVAGSRFAPNYMSLGVEDIESDENLALDISLSTYDAINGMQFDVVYPGAHYVTFDNNFTLGTRADGMSVSTRQIDTNTLRVFGYFVLGGSIASGDGKILTLLLKAANDDVPVGDYNVSIKNIKLGTSELANKYAGTDITGTFHVAEASYVLGDANNDGSVTVGDIVSVVNIMTGNTGNYNLKAADANKDGTFSVGDIVTIVNIISGNN